MEEQGIGGGTATSTNQPITNTVLKKPAQEKPKLKADPNNPTWPEYWQAIQNIPSNAEKIKAGELTEDAMKEYWEKKYGVKK